MQMLKTLSANTQMELNEFNISVALTAGKGYKLLGMWFRHYESLQFLKKFFKNSVKKSVQKTSFSR